MIWIKKLTFLINIRIGGPYDLHKLFLETIMFILLKLTSNETKGIYQHIYR